MATQEDVYQEIREAAEASGKSVADFLRTVKGARMGAEYYSATPAHVERGDDL